VLARGDGRIGRAGSGFDRRRRARDTGSDAVGHARSDPGPDAGTRSDPDTGPDADTHSDPDSYPQPVDSSGFPRTARPEPARSPVG
jgi:hypothetical protein